MKQNKDFMLHRNKTKILVIPSILLIICLGYGSKITAQTTNLGIGSGTAGDANSVYIGTNTGPQSSGGKNLFIGNNAGFNSTSGSENTFMGFKTGYFNTSGVQNVAGGALAGYSNTKGNNNTFLGYASGRNNTTGNSNTSIGYKSGFNTTNGKNNLFVGAQAGMGNTVGDLNSYVGYAAGLTNTNGIENIYLGANAGMYSTNSSGNVLLGKGTGLNLQGNNNVLIGPRVGQNLIGDNKLFIDNSNSATPLLYGEFDNDKLIINGRLGVNTSSFPTTVGTANISSYNLFVKGGILTEEVRVRIGWADFVFDEHYSLMPLQEVKSYIQTNGHLPNVPSAKKVETDGLSLGEIAKIQQMKIEELTLYILKQQEQIDQLNNKINQLLK